MGRDKAPKARQTTNKPSTTLITSSHALSWDGGSTGNRGGWRVRGRDDLTIRGPLIAQ